MARPKREKEVPKFDQKKGWALAQKGNAKFITQGDALFSYAEPKGPFIEELNSRRLEPHPVFIMWSEEWELQEKKKMYDDLKVRTFAISQQLTSLEKELKAEGVLDDTS